MRRYITGSVLALLTLTVAVLYGPWPAAAQGAGTAPVVVELYTSQGCSSCPPADALLTELARRPGIVALSLHVDYWDYIGWRDPYGSPMNTERQRRYADTLGLPYVYTPQMIIDGRDNVVGSNRDEVLDLIDRALARGKPLAIEILTGSGGKAVIPAGEAPAAGATVWLAVFDREHATPVKRGENAGRMIRNSNVVRSFERLGTWTGKRLEVPLDLDGAAARGRFGCAVLVQQGRTGPILGAAAMTLDSLDH